MKVYHPFQPLVFSLLRSLTLGLLTNSLLFLNPAHAEDALSKIFPTPSDQQSFIEIIKGNAPETLRFVVHEKDGSHAALGDSKEYRVHDLLQLGKKANTAQTANSLVAVLFFGLPAFSKEFGKNFDEREIHSQIFSSEVLIDGKELTLGHPLATIRKALDGALRPQPEPEPEPVTISQTSEDMPKISDRSNSTKRPAEQASRLINADNNADRKNSDANSGANSEATHAQ